MGILISLPVSLLLLWLVLKPKKDDPFPRGGLARLIFAGVLSTLVSVLISWILTALIALIRIGPDTLGQIFSALQNDPASVPALLESISSNRTVSPLRVLFGTLITAGLLEELCKYAAGRIAVRREGMVRTWMDSVICFTVVALVFELLENLFHAQSGILTAVFRNLAPVHFICGVIMGWYFGKALVTGQKKYRWSAVLVPTLIHTFYDTALSLMNSAGGSESAGTAETIYIILGLSAFAAAMVMAVVVIVKLVKWRKSGALNVPVGEAASPCDASVGL